MNQKHLIPKKELEEYKRFAFQKSMTEMAVAFILGAAFQKVVNSISTNLFMPFIQYFINITGENWRNYKYSPVHNLNIEIGAFLGNFVDFLLISIILFVVYKKIISKFMVQENTTVKCESCLSDINVECKRCPFCTTWRNDGR